MSSLLKNLLIALGIALVLWLGYMFLMPSAKSDTALNTSNSTSPNVAVESQQLLSTIQKLKTYNVDSTIFTDQRFVSLKDFRIPLTDEPSGRPNPFAPVQ